MGTRKVLLLAGVVLFLSQGTGHSTTLVVQKKVSDARTLAGRADVGGTSASGVTVELRNSDWHTVLSSTKTDDNGYFSLKRPAAGNLFNIRLSAPGLDTYQLRVRLRRHAAGGHVVNAGTRNVDQRRLMVRVQSSTPANAMNSRESCFIISRIFLRSLFLENHRS
jgi:hypothetical protein